MKRCKYSLPCFVFLTILSAACGGQAYQDEETPADEQEAYEDGEPATESCGLSQEDAIEAYAPERVCQTTTYTSVAGYCTHWVACSSF